MSKQDGYASRTPADLERKYKFGETFSEVFGLVSDARKIAEEAQLSYEKLDQEAIFNLLTNYGKTQGIYRDDNGDVYINASFIKSGKLAAEHIETKDLQLSATNIELEGYTSINQAFSVDEAGNMRAAGGTIGGWTIDGLALFAETTAFVEPGREEYDFVRDTIMETNVTGVLVGSNEQYKLYDFDNDGYLTDADCTFIKNCSAGTKTIADWDKAVKTKVTMRIDPTNPYKTIRIYGTNMWGREFEQSYGLEHMRLSIWEKWLGT